VAQVDADGKEHVCVDRTLKTAQKCGACVPGKEKGEPAVWCPQCETLYCKYVAPAAVDNTRHSGDMIVVAVESHDGA
jgi:hypothetical protein